MFDWSKYNGNLDWLRRNTVLLTLAGSHAYGLATEASDYDWRGVCIPPPRYFHGFLQKFDQADKFEATDCVIFDIRKFFSLACDGNPNVIEILWTDLSELAAYEPAGSRLRSIRDEFLSRKVKHTFSGYAIAQLKRIKTHRKWLLKPPDHKPTRAEFNLPETTLVSQDIMGAIEALDSRGELSIEASLQEPYSQHIMTAYQRERAYHNALREWQQYENWRQTRNKQRAELEAKFGYDTKHAMHLVRLMRMGAEILSTGEVIVKRPDREELLEIRGGAWTYDRIVGYTEEMEAKLVELEKTSHLPHGPNRAMLDNVCQQIVEEFYGWIT